MQNPTRLENQTQGASRSVDSQGGAQVGVQTRWGSRVPCVSRLSGYFQSARTQVFSILPSLEWQMLSETAWPCNILNSDCNEDVQCKIEEL